MITMPDCDNCGEELESGDFIYCGACLDKCGAEIAELEKKIEDLEEELEKLRRRSR